MMFVDDTKFHKQLDLFAIMWSPPILKLLTVLAGQDYDGLWKFVLM